MPCPLLTVALAAAVFPLRRLDNTDTWWHLAAGHRIVSHRSVPYTDPPSSTVRDHAWINVQWPFDVVVYGLFALGGAEAARARVGDLVRGRDRADAGHGAPSRRPGGCRRPRRLGDRRVAGALRDPAGEGVLQQVYYDETSVLLVRRAGNADVVACATAAFEAEREATERMLLEPVRSWQWQVGRARGVLVYASLLGVLGKGGEAARFRRRLAELGGKG